MPDRSSRQRAEATREPGGIDLDRLADLVGAADDGRHRTDRPGAPTAEEVRQAHARLLEALEVVPEGLVLLNAEGQCVFFNQHFLEIYDIAPDKIAVGAYFFDAVRVGLERGLYLDAIGREEEWLAERAEQIGKDRSSTEQHLSGDRWVRIEERRTADGGSIGIRIDITDLKRREEALKRRSDQLLEAQRLGKTGDWSYRIGDAEFWWSPQIYALLAYDPATFRPEREAVMALCQGESAKIALATHAEVLRSGQARSVDLKVRRGDGAIADIAMTAQAMTDAGGQVVGLHGTIQDIGERKAAEEALEKLAYFDPLTGLANRALFQRELDNVLARCGKSGSRAALLLLDLDHFKEVNDSLGHEAGDELLVRVSQLIAKVLDENHFFCRLGGDEFAVIMPGDPTKSAVMRLAAKVVVAASGTVVLERGEVGIGTSIGIALVPEDSDGAVDLQRKADLALYRAKANGRGRFAFFEHEMSTVLQYKTALARELRRAVTENIGLEVHYQPQVTLASGRVTGYEALMRWRHPALGMVPPAEFIPVAESSHLICDLGLYILRQAVGQARAWLDAGETGREISVNVSAAQIWQTDFINDVARVLAETGLPPNLLCVELTESLLADHSGRARPRRSHQPEAAGRLAGAR